MDEEEEFFFFTFCDLNETLIFMSKFRMEACPQMKYELVVQRKEEYITCPKTKIPKVEKKIDFLYSKVNISKRSQTENFQWLGVFETNVSDVP